MSTLLDFIARKIWRPIPARRLGPPLEDYIRRCVVPSGKFGAAPIRLESVESGANTVVRRWATGKESAGTVYVRAWPWNGRKRPSRDHATASALLAEAGLGVPAILWRDDAFSTFRRWRLEATIETEAAGRSLSDAPQEFPSLLPEIARQLARLHDRSGPKWGKPWRPDNERKNPETYHARRIAKFKRLAGAGKLLLSADHIERGLRQLETRLARVGPGKGAGRARPALIHGDIHGGHLFADEEGRITWIDFGTVRYGFAEEDLAAVRSTLCRRGGFEEFLEQYLAAQSAEREIDLDAIDTFELFELWERVHSRANKRRRRHERLDTDRPDEKIERLEAEQRGFEKSIIEKIDADPPRAG